MNRRAKGEHDFVVLGAGEAGLAISRELAHRDLEHVVLERGRIGESWRGRWKSFCLVTPNWTMQLPDQPYDGENPDAFDARDEIVGFLERYAARFEVPVQEAWRFAHYIGGSKAAASSRPLSGRWRHEEWCSRRSFQRPTRLLNASKLPTGLLPLEAGDYRSPAELPTGPVLVVGSGQSGCQIAEELVEAGRDVYLSCGRAPWLPRRIGDHDFVWWLYESGFLEATVESLPEPKARLWANVLATGRDGGHDLHLRTLHRMGAVLLGHFLGVDGHRARFRPDLSDSLAWGDERYLQLRELHFVRGGAWVSEAGYARSRSARMRMRETLDLKGFGAVVFAGGFRPDYESWVRIPGAFDELGFPIHENGASPVAKGLYFIGVHFLRKRKSSSFAGVCEDAPIVAHTIAETGRVPVKRRRRRGMLLMPGGRSQRRTR